LAGARPRADGAYVSIGTKAALGLCLVLAIGGVATAMELSGQTRDRLVQGKVTAATMVADLFAASVTPALDFDDHEALAQEAEKLRANPEVEYAAVYRPAGAKPVAAFARVRGAPVPARPTGGYLDVRSDHIDATRILTAADGRVLGSLVLRVSLATENRRFEEARQQIAQVTGFVTLASALGLLLILKRLVATPLQGLARAARKLEQGSAEPVPIRANDEIGQLGGAFNAMAGAIVDRERRLGELNRELFQLLDGMREAILVFEEGGALASVRSHQAEVIFDAKEIEGITVQELLYGRRRNDVGAAAFEEWLRVVFRVDPSDWADVEELAPKEVTRHGPDGEQILLLDFRPIESEGRIARIMLLASDETEKRRLERTVQERDEEHERQMGAMRRLVAGGGQLLVSVLGRARERLRSCEKALEGCSTIDLPLIEQLFQHVHSVKGEARAFDLSLLEAKAAALEDYLAILRGRLREGHALEPEQIRRELAPRFVEAREAVAGAREMLVQASPIGEAILKQVTVQREDVEALMRAAGGRADEIGTLVGRLAARPFGELLLGLTEAVPRWAARESKRARLEVEGREVRIPAALAQILPDAMTHLVRNAIAHGIEPVADRARRAKDETGVIRLTATETPGGPVVTAEDDGRGLDEEAIRGRARELGIPIDGAPATELVLREGLSTAAGGASTEMAGRGVGLGAVVADLARVGYAATLHSGSNGLKVTMAPFVPAAPRRAEAG